MGNIIYVIIGLILFFMIINSVRKGKIAIVESFFWVCGAVAILIFAIFPTLIDQISKLLHVNNAPALFLMMCIIFLMLIEFRHSKQIALQNDKIIELAQNIALIKNKK